MSKNSFGFTKVFPGVNHCFALNDNHQLFAWGDNSFGQTGYEKGLTLQTPYLIDIHHLAKDEYTTHVACGLKHSLCLTNKGRVFVAGSNELGQLGLLDSSDTNSFTPLTFPELFQDETIVQIKAGHYHSVALTSTGRIFTWGSNQESQLGMEAKIIETKRLIELYLPLNSDEWITDLSVGWNHNIVLTNEHRVIGWGHFEFGQLGLRELSHPQIISITDCYQDEYPVKIFASCNQTMIIMNTNRYFAFGNNQFYQLGSKNRGPFYKFFSSYSRWSSLLKEYANAQIISRFKNTIWNKIFYPHWRRKEYLTMVTSSGSLTIGLSNLGLIYVWGKVGAFKNIMIQHAAAKFIRFVYQNINQNNIFSNQYLFVEHKHIGYIISKPMGIHLPDLLPNEKMEHVQCGDTSCFFMSNQGRVFAIDTSFYTTKGIDSSAYAYKRKDEPKFISPLGLSGNPSSYLRAKMGWLSTRQKNLSQSQTLLKRGKNLNE